MPDIIESNLHYRRHILSQRVENRTFSKPTSVAKLVEEAGYPAALQDGVAVALDGEYIPREEWERTKAMPTQHVFMAMVPAGGGDGKTVLAAVASLALVAFAAWAAPLLATTLIGQQVASAAILFIGSMLLNSLFAPPVPDAVKDEPSFAITGIRNSARPGKSIKRTFGRLKVFPDIGASPFTISQSEQQYLYTLFDFGYGPLKLSDLRIGNTPISEYDDIDVNIIPDALDGSQLKIYRNDHRTASLGQRLLFNDPQIITTDGPANGAVLDVAFPIGLGRTRSSDGEQATFSVELDIEFREQGTTTWLPYSDAATSANNTGLQGQSEVLVYAALRTTQGALTGNFYSGYENDFVYYIPEGTSTFVVSSDTAVESGQMIFLNGQTLLIDTVTALGGNRYSVTTFLALNADTVIMTEYDSVAKDPTTVGSGINLRRLEWANATPGPQSLTITKKVFAPFTVSFNLEFPEPPDPTNPPVYELRITRISPDTDLSDRKSSRTDLATLRTIRYRSPINFQVPHTIVEVRIKATDQLSGSLDTFSAIAEAYVNEYDATGSVTATTLSRNPAWIALHVLLSDESEKPVPPGRIDWGAWVEFAQWCDEIDATAGDPRQRCDITVSGSTVGKVVETILKTGRATLSISDGLYSVIWDEEQTVPVQLITTHNSTNLAATRTFVDAPDGIRVQFTDPQQDWQQGEVVVYNDGFDENNATKYNELSLAGVTRSNQIYRDVRYFMAQTILRQENLVVTMDWENLVATRGDLVMVQEEGLYIGGLPGRVKAINGLQVTSTEPFNIQGGNTYAVRQRLSTGVQQTIDVAAQIDQYTVELVSPPTGLQVGDLLVWGVKTLEALPYLIKAITPKPNLEAELSLMQLAPAVYTADTAPIPPYNPGISDDLMAAPLFTPELAIEIIVVDDSPAFKVNIDWVPIPGIVEYEIWVRIDGVSDEWSIFGLQPEGANRYTLFDNLTLDIDLKAPTNIYYVRVIGRNVFGRKSSFPESPIALFDPANDPIIGGTPPSLVLFDGDIRSEEIYLQWAVQEDWANVRGFVIKYSPRANDANWNDAQQLGGELAWDRREATFPARLGSYMIKTVSLLGIPAALPNVVVTTIPALPNLRFLEMIDPAPQWVGVANNVVISKSMLFLATNAEGYVPEGTFEYGTELVLDEIQNVRLQSKFAYMSVGASELVSSWNPVSSVQQLSEAAPESVVRAVQELRWYDSVAAQWSAWTAFVNGDYAAQRFQFRIRMRSLDELYTPVVTSGLIEASVPYRVEERHDVFCSEGGIRVEYDKPFQTPPALAVTSAKDINDYYQITNADARGFNIQFFTRASRFSSFGATAIQQTFDYQARGYGAVEKVVSNVNARGAVGSFGGIKLKSIKRLN